MKQLAQVMNYRFPTVDFPIMRFQIRLSEITRLQGFIAENLVEDGLGEVLAIFLRLLSGHVVLFAEYQHLIEYKNEKGPTVYIDAGIVAEFGVEYLIGEVLESVKLSPQTIDWVASSEQQTIAIDIMKRVTRVG